MFDFDRYPNEQIAIAILSNLQTSPVGKIGRELAAILWSESYKLPQKQKAIDLDPTI